MKKILIILIPFLCIAQTTEPPLTNLSAWWKTDAGLVTSDTDITSWTDQINSIVLLSPKTEKPQIISGSINNIDAISFDSVNDFLITDDIDALSATTAYTLVLFFKRNISTSSPNEAIVFKKDTTGVSDASTSYGLVLNFAGDPSELLGIRLASNNYASGQIISDTDWHYVEWSSGSGGTYMYLDEVQVVDEAETIVGDYAGSEFAISGHWNAGGTKDSYFNGQIAEILFYKSQLSTSERDELTAYINYKYYGISGDTKHKKHVQHAGHTKN